MNNRIRRRLLAREWAQTRSAIRECLALGFFYTAIALRQHARSLAYARTRYTQTQRHD